MNPDPQYPNRGDCYRRTEHSPLEKAFADLWEEMNDLEFRRNMDFGQGILQDLFCDPDPILRTHCPHMRHQITPEERFVAATVIQWLGSNVGFSFLMRALEREGYRIVRKEYVK